MKDLNKAEYSNWMPFYLIVCCFLITTAVILTTVFLFSGVFGTLNSLSWIIIKLLFIVISFICIIGTVKFMYARYAFSYTGAVKLSKRIIEYVSDHVQVKEGESILDVGCGSGALSIACAKRNPQASVTGIDRWGKEYSNFSKTLCEQNAEAEGVPNIVFKQGNAVKLDFPNETFNAVTSNYVYHNIPGNKQTYLLETLRTLKKGGSFAVHDLFSKKRYGNMTQFIQYLKDSGYEKVELIPTVGTSILSKKLSYWTMLKGSFLLYGKK